MTTVAAQKQLQSYFAGCGLIHKRWVINPRDKQKQHFVFHYYYVDDPELVGVRLPDGDAQLWSRGWALKHGITEKVFKRAAKGKFPTDIKEELPNGTASRGTSEETKVPKKRRFKKRGTPRFKKR